jgi:hypothetical protein
MNLGSQVANYLKLEESQVSIEPGDRIAINCKSAREQISISEKWCDLTVRFHDRAQYLLLRTPGVRDVEFPIDKRSLKMFSDLYPSICTGL